MTDVLAELASIRASVDALEAHYRASATHLAPTPEKPAPAPPPPVSAAPAPAGLQKPSAFFDYMRKSPLMGPTLSKEEVSGCETILAAATGKLPMSWVAYCLATAHHETGGEMAPNVESLTYSTAQRIREVWPTRFPTLASAQPFVRNAKALANHVYNGRMGNRPGSNDGWDFRGRGQAHLTGRENYERADRELGLGGELVRNPDLALRPDIAAQILVVGMLQGWFTGKKLNDYIPAKPSRDHFINARRIINPDVNGPKVATAAEAFMPALKLGDWR